MAIPTQQMLNGLAPMPINYDGGYIALSYIISATGSTTCLELLHRRSSRSGLLNWFVPMHFFVCLCLMKTLGICC